MMVCTNRTEIEDLIYKTYDALDPSGANSDKFKALFADMNDQQFAKWLKEFLNNDKDNFMLDVIDFERDLKFDNCEKAAKVLDIPLFEYVYMPHLTMDKSHTVVSKEKCLVGWLEIKRTQQLLIKKNGISVNDDKRSALTGQVVDHSKNSRSSDIENEMLVALGADKIMQELNGPRSDDMTMKREMNQSIATKGFVELDELTNLPTQKVALNTVNSFLLSMGIKSDIVSDTYILPKTSGEIFD